MGFMQSRNFSLFCAGVNGFFAMGALTQANWPLFFLCVIFFGICLNNYRSQ